jgi:hypothetical protein
MPHSTAAHPVEDVSLVSSETFILLKMAILEFVRTELLLWQNICFLPHNTVSEIHEPI